MKSIIYFCFTHTRTVLTTLVFMIITGIVTYITIPKESNPDIKIPVMNIAMFLDGISPEDAEKQILRPAEQQLKTLEGIREMTSVAFEGGGHISLEFDAGFNTEKAKADVKDKIDAAKPDFPQEMRDPTVTEVELSRFPVLIVKLSGDLPERTLYNLASDLKDTIEGQVKTVLRADVRGDRKEIAEITVHPAKLENYNLSMMDVINFVRGNNIMISAGNLETKTGRYPIKVPGLIETVEDLYNLPISSSGDSVLTFQDIAQVKRVFADPEFFSRDRGQKTVSLQIIKRSGENVIDTINSVKTVVEDQKQYWPGTLQVSYSQDQSPKVLDMLRDLQNNVIVAILLVMIVIIASMGVRPALLIGIAVPGSFLTGILIIGMLGYTINIIVLFSLILSIGMLVDGAIIVVEYADRKMIDGMNKFDAYKEASIRMLWPVVSSTATILVVFLPLLFWPGIVGQFMKFLPITLIAVLSASLMMALIFVPTLGSLFAKVSHTKDHQSYQTILKTESGDLLSVQGVTGLYIRALDKVLDYPKRIVFASIGLLIIVILFFKFFGKGVEFFPNIEPDQATVVVHARGNLSVYEKDDIMKKVENAILGMREIKSIDSTTYAMAQGNKKEDVIGEIYLEFVDWKERRRVEKIMQDIAKKTEDIPGIIVDAAGKKEGPVRGKPVEIVISSRDLTLLDQAAQKITGLLSSIEGFKDIEDNRFTPGIQWEMHVDKAQAAKYKLDVQTIGAMIKLLTNGVKLGTYRPSDSKDQLDVILRFPEEFRTLDQISALKAMTVNGLVPLSSMMTYSGEKKVGLINRTGGVRTLTVKADVRDGFLVNNLLPKLKEKIAILDLPLNLKLDFKGQEKDQKENMIFLSGAFMIAIFLISIILITQFNSFFKAFLILSAVVISTIGVFIGLLVREMPFGIVMGGLGVISLAGIIVSNNIILIDTFDHLKQKIPDIKEVILRTCAQRLRPVILTKLTIILGLLPIMFAVDLNFWDREISIGAPSTQWWVQLSTCIVYGVLFASILTLFVTPSALMLWEKRSAKNL